MTRADTLCGPTPGWTGPGQEARSAAAEGLRPPEHKSASVCSVQQASCRTRHVRTGPRPESEQNQHDRAEGGTGCSRSRPRRPEKGSCQKHQLELHTLCRHEDYISVKQLGWFWYWTQTI